MVQLPSWRTQVVEFKRELIERMLANCTEQDRKGFERIFLATPDRIPERDLDAALDLCERTVRTRERERGKA